MPVIDVVSDTNVVLKWFYQDGEEEAADSALDLLDLYSQKAISLRILNLTPYEVGNAMIRKRATQEEISGTVSAVVDICPIVTPSGADWSLAAALAVQHGLSFYDAAYAAVAQRRNAYLATFDRKLLGVGLGQLPDKLIHIL
ncbi:MAG: type II toxin-antitoxin system VapC family toxin [Candidatus Dormibacteraceae bacterium]